MLVAVGSINPVKVCAVKDVICDYSLLSLAQVTGFSVPSEVSEQPLSLEETITGAKNRAKNAFYVSGSSIYSFGIESGLMQAPGTQTGYFEATVCAIYDGENYGSGLSLGFEVPPQILDLVLKDKIDLGKACYRFGITRNTKLGSQEGLIGILTKNRVDRKAYTRQSIVTALIQLENPNLYKIQPSSMSHSVHSL